MATTALDTDCGCGGAEHDSGDGALPANPFTALQYHFGMLLGVDDLETAQAYPRGKIRLHNAWLHREGVVWGLDVGFNSRRELTVKPGLALDAAGHELHLDATACVDLGKWYDKHKDDDGFIFTDDGAGGTQFDVHVVARFRACLARPVPAIADPCAGSELDTAFSRVSETIELLLRPGKAPPKDLGYHRLRILFSLEDDATQYDEVKTRRESILALALDQQPRAYLDAFREFAALDEIDLSPQVDESGVVSSLFPEDPTDVVLADVVGIDLRPAAGVGATGWAIVDPLPTPNVRIRRSHVATATIQELLCGPLFGALAAAPPPAQPPLPPTASDTPPAPLPPLPNVPAPLSSTMAKAAYAGDAGGPRVDPASATIKSSRRISLDFSAPLSLRAVGVEQFSVTAFSSKGGWTTLDISDVKLDSAANTVVLEMKDTITASSTIRLIARGTGPQPLLGTDHVPLAGAIGGPPGSVNDGHDFVIMLRRK
ncbi:MAG: hypothetical protein ABI664_02450 [bacterium]